MTDQDPARGVDGLFIDRADYIDRNRLLLERTTNSYQQVVFDDGTNTCRVETITDVAPTLEANKRFQVSGSDGYTASRAMRYVAEIDVAIIQQWNTLHGVNVLAPENKALFRRLLNDKDNEFLRTGLGRL